MRLPWSAPLANCPTLANCPSCDDRGLAWKRAGCGSIAAEARLLLRGPAEPPRLDSGRRAGRPQPRCDGREGGAHEAPPPCLRARNRRSARRVLALVAPTDVTQGCRRSAINPPRMVRTSSINHG